MSMPITYWECKILCKSQLIIPSEWAQHRYVNSPAVCTNTTLCLQGSQTCICHVNKFEFCIFVFVSTRRKFLVDYLRVTQNLRQWSASDVRYLAAQSSTGLIHHFKNLCASRQLTVSRVAFWMKLFSGLLKTFLIILTSRQGPRKNQTVRNHCLKVPVKRTSRGCGYILITSIIVRSGEQ